MRKTLVLAVGLLGILLLVSPAAAQRGRRGRRGGGAPVPAPVGGGAPVSGETLEERVPKAIAKGVEKVWSLRQADGSWEPYTLQEYHFTMGPTALAAYALLEAGVSPQEERMAKTLAWLSTHSDGLTYSTALRCQVWLIANRQTRDKYKKEFDADVKRLIAAGPDGMYEYDANSAPDKALLDKRKNGEAYDNSNSQFGVLGVWAGARANMEFASGDTRYWQAALEHWVHDQGADGGWPYKVHRETTASMTAAGVATMFVCMDNLFTDQFASCEAAPRPEFKVVNRGLDWLSANFQKNMSSPESYFLYGLERVGLASGYKYFGEADWYKRGADYLVGRQGADGGWTGGLGGELQATVFSLLFLVRGSNPVMFNKLEYTGDWNNRPRALANLTEWVGRNFEGAVNWQIINLKVPPSEWHDAPILYLSGSKAPTFTEEELGKLRTYVQQGGTIFSVSECSGKGFNQGIRDVYAKLFPGYELKAVDKDHDLYSVQFHLKGLPQYFLLSNGIRPLAIHVERDMPYAWQRRESKTETWAFEGAVNLYLYVTDKEFIRSRGVSHWPEEPPAAPKKVKVARVKYAGNWDPEPLAYQRLGRLLADREKVGLETSAVEIKDLPGSGAAVATLTGTNALQFSADEKETLKKFMTGGGLLVIDAGGGSRKFAESAQIAIQDMFGAGELKKLDADSPLFDVREIKEVKYRRQTKARLGGMKETLLQGVMVGTRLGVVFSREDLTGGLVGYSSYACDGYAPQTAYEIMRNVMLLAAEDSAPAAASEPAK